MDKNTKTNTKTTHTRDSETKKRKWLTLEEKLDEIKLHEEGKPYSEMIRQTVMNESSVRKIIQNKELYKSQRTATECYLSKFMTKTIISRMFNMERLLSIWIEDLNQKFKLVKWKFKPKH